MDPQQIREICLAFPESSAPPSPGSLKGVIYHLAHDPDRPFDGDYAKAAAWLLERVKVWKGSTICRKLEAKYRPCMARWMREEQYDTPDECWGVGVKLAAKVKPVEIVKEKPSPDLPRTLRFGGGA